MYFNSFISGKLSGETKNLKMYFLYMCFIWKNNVPVHVNGHWNNFEFIESFLSIENLIKNAFPYDRLMANTDRKGGNTLWRMEILFCSSLTQGLD